MKKILALALAVLLLASLVACGDKNDNNDDSDKESEVVEDVKVYNNFAYGVNEEGNFEITGFVYTGSDRLDVEIPAEIGGRPVTGIGDNAFNACMAIQSITIPSSITYIGDYAFYKCDYLTSVTLPDSVVSLGIGVFQDCSSLTTVTLSKSLRAISDFAFLNCKKLASINLEEGLLSIGTKAFENCLFLTEVTIPTTVEKIGSAAFYGCKQLEKVTALGTALLYKEPVADEEDATKITIVTNIGEIVFHQCASTLKLTVTEGSGMAAYAADNSYALAE